MSASKKITHHWQLEVYKLSVEAGMQLFALTKQFPREEMYSLTDQVRRSSRSVSGHIAEGWRRRRYQAAFCDKLNGAEAEAAETQTWIEYSVRCGYLSDKEGRHLHRTYDRLIGKLVTMQNNPESPKRAPLMTAPFLPLPLTPLLSTFAPSRETS